MEIEIKLPYPEKIVKEVKRIIKRKLDDKKEEERKINISKRNHELFVKKNPLFKIPEKLYGYLILLGSACILITAFGEYFLPSNIKNSLEPYMGVIFYTGLISYLFTFLFIALVDALAARFKGKKLFSSNKKNIE
ncbi:MAG: hypothetical protein ABIJ05_03175 [Patescibacteria group bacterium]